MSVRDAQLKAFQFLYQEKSLGFSLTVPGYYHDLV